MKVAPELLRDFISMIGPKKPHYISGFVVNNEGLVSDNVFMVTFLLTEEYKKKLDINFPVFMSQFYSKADAALEDKEEVNEILKWLVSIRELSEDMQRYFPIKKIDVEIS